METLERLKTDYDEIDLQIESGHTYAGIFLALPYAKDEFQRKDMEATLQTLLESSGYIRAVFDSHHDPISFLASRGSRFSDMVQRGILQERGQFRGDGFGRETRRVRLHLCGSV